MKSKKYQEALIKWGSIFDQNQSNNLLEKGLLAINSAPMNDFDSIELSTLNLYSALEDLSRHSLFFEKNIIKAKQFYYLNARVLAIRAMLLNDPSSFGLYLFDTQYFLLSDNSEVINWYANFETDQIKKGRGFLLVPALQAVLRDDFEKFTQVREKCSNHKRYSKTLASDFKAMEGIFEKNKSKIEEAVYSLCTKEHKRRNDEGILTDLISIPATIYAKLAWIKGIEVEVDSELIPKELLPVKPNEQYFEYEFMKKEEFSLYINI